MIGTLKKGIWKSREIPKAETGSGEVENENQSSTSGSGI